MPITPIQLAAAPQIGTIKVQPNRSSIFSTALAVQPAKTPPPATEAQDALPYGSSEPDPPASDAPIWLGKIGKEHPSVSHLLINHAELHSQCWDIVSSAVNREKNFTGMRRGTDVYFDPNTKELLWGDAIGKNPGEPEVGPTDSDENTPANGAPSEVRLGAIDSVHPTLSHLLKGNPDYSEKTWDIIFAATNRHKPYTSLRPGCQVSINPQTLELTFQYGKPLEVPEKIVAPEEPYCLTEKRLSPPPEEQSPENPLAIAPDAPSFGRNLVASVKTYLGRPYHTIDCYGLVIKGLEDLGVHYVGTDGLQQRLRRMAVAQGLPDNAYHNGEGLIDIAGQKVFDQSFAPSRKSDQEINQLVTSLSPMLEEGMLLSFSTPSRGHTGVISNQAGQWTYINSGFMDHQVDGGKTAKRVGEERLTEEIKNWFNLAEKERSSLKISVGKFDTAKLQPAAQLAERSLLAPPAGGLSNGIVRGQQSNRPDRS